MLGVVMNSQWVIRMHSQRILERRPTSRDVAETDLPGTYQADRFGMCPSSSPSATFSVTLGPE